MIKNRTPEYARERMISRRARLDEGNVIDNVSEFDAEWKSAEKNAKQSYKK